MKLDGFLIEIGKASESKGGPLRFEGLTENIEFDDVSFSYGNKGSPALTGVKLNIPARKMTAVVGPSGAGKSTLIDLLPRFRAPATGEIRFDGIAINQFSTSSLRAGIAFVPQQPQIFNISAAEHIRYGKEDASVAEMREAARLAGALTFIEELPDGFDTPLGEGGRRLSGGQRQRLDIARALVRRAPILILDEPSSAVDADAEVAFRDALCGLRRATKLSIIVIAHRLSTIADADQIIVLEGGTVRESGTHGELLSKCGWYANAYRAQHGISGNLQLVSSS
jgi:ABC-type multidrug transport system fused ATPase/permease subunit